MSNDINVLDAFMGGEDFSVLATDPASLNSNGKTTTLVKGRRVPFQATFAGISFPAYATLESAYLHRVSVIDHVSLKQNGKVSKLVTGIFKPVKMNVEVVFDGEISPFQTFFVKSLTAELLQTVRSLKSSLLPLWSNWVSDLLLA